MTAELNQRESVTSLWSPTDDLKELADADCGMIGELVTMFIGDTAARVTTLSSAFLIRDFGIVRAQAHSLKGSALQLGATDLARLSAELEMSERHEQCEFMIQAIHREFDLVRHAMEEYLIDNQVTA